MRRGLDGMSRKEWLRFFHQAIVFRYTERFADISSGKAQLVRPMKLGKAKGYLVLHEKQQE